jgi:elongation factor Ts
MEIKPAQVKELRERTGVGMMDCKKALVETGGDIDAAAEYLRKAGQAKADKKAGRVAAEGRIIVTEASNSFSILEINAETDFVANDENFLDFAGKVGDTIVAEKTAAKTSRRMSRCRLPRRRRDSFRSTTCPRKSAARSVRF